MSLTAGVMDRLSLNPRPGRAAPRLRTGLSDLDTRIEGGLERGGLHEVRAEHARDIGTATAAVLSLIAQAAKTSDRRRILWITDPGTGVDAGLLYPDGLAQYGLAPGDITLVTPVDFKTALWAADEGAKCPDLLAVILHVQGNPKRLDRVATRRLLIRARDSGTFVCLLRQSGAEEANAALTRWHTTPRPSLPDPAFPAGIGLPRMRLSLERSRTGQTGDWTLHWNPRTRTLAHAPDRQTSALPQPRPAAPADRPDRAGPLGQVVDFGRPA